jgi:hypothetical protein
MNATELTDRLIGDLKSSIIKRNSTPDLMTQVSNLGVGVKGDFLGALNPISFDAHLNILTQMLNLPSNKVDQVLSYIELNRNSIIEIIDELLHNSNIISLDNLEPVESLLREELDTLHRYSGSNF